MIHLYNRARCVFISYIIWPFYIHITWSIYTVEPGVIYTYHIYVHTSLSPMLLVQAAEVRLGVLSCVCVARLPGSGAVCGPRPSSRLRRGPHADAGNQILQRSNLRAHVTARRQSAEANHTRRTMVSLGKLWANRRGRSPRVGVQWETGWVQM